MTICVNAVFLGSTESKLHFFGSLYLKRLFSSVSPLYLRINGTGTSLNWTAHKPLDPVRNSVLVGPRKPGLHNKSFSSVARKVVSSQGVIEPRYQLRSSGPAARKSAKLLQGWGMCTGKKTTGAHLLRHLLQLRFQRIQLSLLLSDFSSAGLQSTLFTHLPLHRNTALFAVVYCDAVVCLNHALKSVIGDLDHF